MQNNPEIIPSNLTKIFLSSPIQTSTSVFYLKIFYLIIIWAISFIFGLLPLCFNNCRKDLRLLNYANAFSAGIFLGIGFFHILPEATENFENYFLNEGKDSYIKGWPIVYLLAFLSYSLILYIEKVAFNSHALIAHTHKHDKNDIEENNLNEPLLGNTDKDKVYHDCNLYEKGNDNINNENLKNSSDEEIGQDEQIIRNVVSSKGQFSSLLHSRNLSK
jgi:zinc transporter 1/2/3